MLKNRLTRLLLVVLLILTAITSGAYAYMVKVTSVKQNELLPAAVYCEVVEEFDGTNKTSVQVQSNVEDANGNMISNIDVYIRVKLVTNWYKVDGEEYILVGQRFNDPHRVLGRNAYVAFAFELCRRVDVADNSKVVVFTPHFFNNAVGNHVRHGAVCRKVGHQNLFVGVEYFCAFAHKAYPAENNDVGIALFCNFG